MNRCSYRTYRALQVAFNCVRHARRKAHNAVSSSPAAGIRLRQYQEECIQSVLSHLAKGDKRLGISLATGSGKTVIFTHLIDRVSPPQQDATQTLILVHRRELVEQAASHCNRTYPDKTIEIEMGNIHASGAADITIASVRSILSAERIQKFNKDRFKLILVDEAHHIVAPGYMDVLEYFGLLKPLLTSPALVGVSATLSRFDGMRLGAAIDHIVYHKDYVDMIGEKFLSEVIFTTVKSQANILAVKNGANGDFNPSDLSRAINTPQTNELTVRAWLARAGERKSTIVFCVDLAHVAGLTNEFRARGVDARFVTGDTAKVERSQRLDAFRNGEFPVLINCGVFTEGTDIPNIDCVLLARPTRSRNLLVQMIGRGMRLHTGKRNCHIIDMVASLEAGIVTTPTLFGLDPSDLVSDATVDDMKDLRDRKEAEKSCELVAIPAESLENAGPLRGSLTFTDYGSVHDLIDDTSGERHIRALSPLAWVQVSHDKYVLSTQSGHYLTLQTTDDNRYVVSETRKLHSVKRGNAPFMPPKEKALAETFADAVHAADTYAQETYSWYLISKNQPWRKDDATENQIKFINGCRPADKKLALGEINKGKAGDMITKIKHGARGWFNKIEADKKRAVKKVERAQEKAEELQDLMKRETVRVGPVLS